MTPQNLAIQAVLFIRRGGPRLIRWSSRVGLLKVGGGALVATLATLAILVMTRGSAEPAPAVTVHRVEVKSVAELSSEMSPLSVVGQVSSKSEATVRAERSGQVIAIYKALGDVISAGAIAAELENASERAAVLQAEGVVEAAQANLSKISGGARSEQRAILESNLANASASFDAARSGAVNALLSAYATMDSAILGTTDKMFTNPTTNSPIFLVLSTDSQLTNKIENMRPAIGEYVQRQALFSNTLSASSDLLSEIATTEGEVRTTRGFVDMIVSALNRGIPTSSASATAIATYLTQASTARTTLTTSLASLSGATQVLASANSAVEVARKNLEQGVGGGQAEDVATAKAVVKQAQGSLAAARANLEKTVIRAPISGTINSFSLKRGDYVQMASPVLTVANNGALEVVAYITENDAREVAVGARALIDETSGVVIRVAPALDPITKKIEVRIGVDDASDLINGQSVLVSLMRMSAVGSLSRITVPLSSIKMESDRVVVFSVGDEGTLIAHPVVLGVLLGERVVVSSGLSGEMHIVTDARGLREGEKVETQ